MSKEKCPKCGRITVENGRCSICNYRRSFSTTSSPSFLDAGAYYIAPDSGGNDGGSDGGSCGGSDGGMLRRRGISEKVS